MTVFFASGSPDADFGDADLNAALTQALDALGPKRRVLVVPPDYSRVHSGAGRLTCQAHDFFGSRVDAVLPALGTHAPMTDEQIARMFPTVPADLFREHRWRTDVVTIGEVPADFVADATGGIWDRSWPAQMNRRIWEGGHDLVLSIGQVVPHEVMGMANFNKNIFIGTGGKRSIDESHFIGAAYGMERMMGVADTPLRRILNRADQLFCTRLPIVYVLTVVEAVANGTTAIRGLFIGDDTACFEQAAALSRAVNVTRLPEPVRKFVVYLDPNEFQSTWLGNKAIYRTRMAIADGGELIVLAPGVRQFGEDPTIDTLIRRYGYRTTPEIMAALRADPDLNDNLAAAAHLIHGSSEGRFSVTYAAGGLSRAEVEGVGYAHADWIAAPEKYPVDRLVDGWNDTPDAGRFYFIRNPALGLWTSQDLGAH